MRVLVYDTSTIGNNIFNKMTLGKTNTECIRKYYTKYYRSIDLEDNATQVKFPHVNNRHHHTASSIILQYI